MNSIRPALGERLASFTIGRRYLVLLLALLTAAMAGSGIRWLWFQTDYRAYFGPDNPQLKAFETIQNTYTKQDNLLFVLAPADGEVFSARTLEAVKWLTARAWRLPYAIRVDSVTNFQYTRGVGDELIVDDLVLDPGQLAAPDLQRIRLVALSEPRLRNRLVSNRGHVTGVNVIVQVPGQHRNVEFPNVADRARALRAEFTGRYPGIDVHLTGLVMMDVAFSEASRHDIATLLPIMFASVVLLLGVLLRSLSGTLGTVAVVALSMVCALGIAGWLGIPMSTASAVAPIIILTLGVANGVHVMANALHAVGAGADKRSAITHSLRVNLQPVFVTSLTTAIGFLSMNFSEAPPLRDLGNIVAIGMLFTFVLSVTFLPALVTALPLPLGAGFGRRGLVMDRLGDAVVRHRHRLLVAVGLTIAALILFLPRNEFNDDFVEYFDPTIEFRRATDFAATHLTGIHTVQFSLDSGQSGGVADPEFLAKVDEFAQWFRAQPTVVHVNTITDTFKRLNQNLHGDDPAWHRLPDSREQAAQYLLLYEMSLPYGLDLNDQINVDKSATRLVATNRLITMRETLDLARRAEQWLQHNAPHVVRGEASSPNIMFAHITERNVRGMLGGTTAALIMISLILVVALRSVRLGLISMLPNLVPAAMAFGLWGLLVGRIGLAVSVVAAITLGIVVDDTVHFLSKYLRARRELALGAGDAVRYAFSSVGMAMAITSLVLACGFMILAQSSFAVNADLGLLTAITIVFALLADFLFLPPLLIALDRDRR